MQKRYNKFLAGMLSVALILSSGSYSAFAAVEDTAENLEAVEAQQVSGAETEPEETVSSQLPEADVNEPEQPVLPEAYEEENEQAEQPVAAVSENEGEGGEENGENEAVEEIQPSVSINGAVEVWITAGVPRGVEQQLHVKLTGMSGNPEWREDIAVLAGTEEGATAASRSSVMFADLESGTYELCVYGEDYIPYTQQIEVSTGLGQRVQLYTGKVETRKDDVKDDVHPGWLVRGDINGDGILDRNDSTDIIRAIESTSGEENSAEGHPCDLNDDKKVDLLDLNYLTEYMDMDRARQVFSIETFVPKEAFSSVLHNGNTYAGDIIERMFERDHVVELSPEREGEISEENPVTLEFNLHESVAGMEGIVIETPKDNAIDTGVVTIEYTGENNEIESEDIWIKNGKQVPVPESLEANARAGEGSAADNNGILEISFRGMVAVKKVTLRITSTTSNTKNLAEISTVEFLNDMASRIPEPDMNIPKELTATPGSKSFSLTWKGEPNVTAYEVRVQFTPDKEDGSDKEPEEITEYLRTTKNSLAVSQFNKGKLKNKREYKVAVQSLNGEWKSGFSDTIVVVPIATAKPPKPDRVTVKGSYKSVIVSWTKMEDEADKFYLYYRAEDEANYNEIVINDGAASTYTVEKLKDDTKYYVYLQAENDLGKGPKSLEADDKTMAQLSPVEMPKYKVINTSNGEGVLSNHIKAAAIGSHSAERVMVDSALDAGNEKSALGLYDNNFASYIQCNDWDWGGAYPANNKGIITELDGRYAIGMITLAEPIDIGTYSYVNVKYWDENNNIKNTANTSIITKHVNGRKFYLIKFDRIETSKIQIGVGRYGSSPRKITISEIQFHEYDSLEDDILGLYADDLHSTLKDTVTEESFQELQTRLDTKEPQSGEYHPERAALQLELDTAKELWNTKNLGGKTAVNPKITSKGDVGVGGLNPWQPLGVAAAAGDEIVVYVSNPKLNKGADTSLSVVFTQYHAESGGFFKSQALKTGRNQITVPKISSTNVEKGGALYVQYSGNNSNDQYAVRVSGGVRIPVLNVYGISGAERTKRIETYVKELNEYVSSIQTEHEKLHKNSGNENVDYAYDAHNCIANATDIVMNQMMFSIPASQALAGLGKGSQAEQAECLANSIQAMEEMMILFYQHKGLTDSFKDKESSAVIAKNHLPYQYLNIRYMRMFAGAFMYASGNHIGIEWGSTNGLTSNNSPVAADEKGKYISGKYFGWGIAHEIGHDINQGAYAYAEVTNNYFSVLAQAKDTNNSVRFSYDNVFKKVTSNTKGYASNVFTQLGMYWQLHLAYDNDYNYKTYDSYKDIIDNLFFARVDTYARDTSRAPVPEGGIKLTLPGDRDQNLMRLASAAAQRDLSEFFERWGMTPTEDTRKYMAQFEPETRAIYYGNDASRVYRMDGGSDDEVSGKEVVTAAAAADTVDGSKITVKMQGAEAAKNSLHGYEVTRIYIEQGEERSEVAGFTQTDTFIDHVPFAANHVITYEVTAIGKCMNRSKPFRTDPVKIRGDGLQDKSLWTINTNMTSDDDKLDEESDEDKRTSCSPTMIPATGRMIDSNADTTYTGSSSASEDPFVILELNQSMEVNALRYICKSEGNPITQYKIEISTDGKEYKEVKAGTFALTDGSEMVYLENGQDKWTCTYDASYVKLTAVGQAGNPISVTELDLYGPSGDNVEFLTKDGTVGIGKLAADYVYEKGEVTGGKDKVIPADSIVFTGEYKGNPAYNVVVVYDENGNIVGGTDAQGDLVAHQIILAPELKDDQALLGETSDGRWIYWIEPDHIPNTLPGKVRAELYRVDNALTNEGQRLVSDTIFETMPKNLPAISISNQ